MSKYRNDHRIVATLDAGGTNFVFGAMQAGEFIVEPLSLPSQAHDPTNACKRLSMVFRRYSANSTKSPWQ